MNAHAVIRLPGLRLPGLAVLATFVVWPAVAADIASRNLFEASVHGAAATAL